MVERIKAGIPPRMTATYGGRNERYRRGNERTKRRAVVLPMMRGMRSGSPVDEDNGGGNQEAVTPLMRATDGGDNKR